MQCRKTFKLSLSVLLFALLSTSLFAQDIAKSFAFAQRQTDLLLREVERAKASQDNTDQFSPRSLNPDGSLALVPPDDWCSGFFAGNLWHLYEYSGNEKWKTQAEVFTAIMEGQKTNGHSHDLGFKVYCSVGNGYRLTHNEPYREVIIEAAKTLSARFNPVVGCIKSWDKPDWKFPVIIDNMMNLELLFEATRLSGDSSFYRIAVAHANTTLKNHFRPDHSSYHLVDYDPATGKVLHRQTVQGYADESAWARGQAWGLYGYTMCYRETGDKVYLRQAEAIARFIFGKANLPKDLIPYWDYNDPGINDPGIPNVPRDVSAAAIMASALYELSAYSHNRKQYRATADKIMKSLSDDYQAPEGGARGFLLLHSTGNKPAKSEIDVPIIYADYYYLEALLRKKRLMDGEPVTGATPAFKN